MAGVGKWYKNLVFRKKVFLSHLAVSLIPVVILGVFCYLQTRRLLIQREREVLRETLEQSVLRMDSSLAMYRAYRDVIDPAVRQMKLFYPQIQRLTIYSSNETLHPHGDILRRIEEAPRHEDAYQDYRIHWKADGQGTLKLYCRIYGKEKTSRNVVYIELDYQEMFDWLSGLFENNYGIMIANGGASPAYSFFVSENGKGACGLTLEELSCGAGCLEDYVLEKREIPANAWKIYLCRPLNTVSSSAISITFLIVGAVGLCLIIIFMVSVLLAKSVVQPLARLIQNIDQIEGENLQVVVQEESRDEIGHLIQSFSRMMERLNTLVNEVYKSRISQQEYEMKALQAQINPHFLYNSLSLINWKAIMADQRDGSAFVYILPDYAE